ncbi:hypothetical protein PanWU01x14_136940, partial [Parasponia andersonii]
MGGFKYECFFLVSQVSDTECLGTTLLAILILVAIFDRTKVTHSITQCSKARITQCSKARLKGSQYTFLIVELEAPM